MGRFQQNRMCSNKSNLVYMTSLAVSIDVHYILQRLVAV